MRGAADRCQRIGACRKSGSGVMCPSRHGHPRGGARHPRARQRAREGALGAGPARGDGRRAAARDPRPLPRVQGVQERVPARRRHGLAEVGVPLAPPGHPRRAAALAAVRRDPAAQPAPRRDRPAVEPAGAECRAPVRCSSERWGSPASARCRASPASTWSAGTARRAGRRADAPPRRRDLPRRLVHHLHRARDRPRGDRAAGGRRPTACGWRAPAAAGARASPRACSSRRAAWPRSLVAAARAGRRARRADRRLRAVLPADAARGAPATAAARPAREGGREAGQARRGAARRGDRRRRARPRPRLAGAQRPRDRLPRPLPPEGARGHGRHARAARARPGEQVTQIETSCCGMAVVRLRGRALRPLEADRR